MDQHAKACRRLWSAVLIAALDDFNREFARRGDAALERAEIYLKSGNCRRVSALAGIDLPLDRALALIALPRRDFKARLVNPKPEINHE